MNRRIRVLVVDDSMLMREMIAKGLSSDSMIEVVGTANDAYMARDQIIALRPDVMTLDVEMPKMSGIDFLKMLMPQYPMPVIVVSAASNVVFDAMGAGAVDFVEKCPSTEQGRLDSMIGELIFKIKIASVSKIREKNRAVQRDYGKNDSARRLNMSKIVAIGASTGGTEAIHEVLKYLPEKMPPIVIVQHMPPVFTRLYAERINLTCKIEVKEAQKGDLLTPGHAYLAPGDSHMKVVRNGSNYLIDVFKGDKVSGHCPSVDVLFNSVAETSGNSAVGVILTGMGGDGAKGLLRMREKGAFTIGQDEESCVVYGMPKVAYDIGGVVTRIGLKDIPHKLMEVLSL